MSEHGAISGGTRALRAVRVAGLLAELAVDRIELDGVQLASRVTDLPGLLAKGDPDRSITAPSLDLTIVVSHNAAEWRTPRQELAATIRARTAKTA